MKSEIEINERLAYWHGVLEGMRLAGLPPEKEGARLHAQTMAQALGWVLTPGEIKMEPGKPDASEPTQTVDKSVVFPPK